MASSGGTVDCSGKWVGLDTLRALETRDTPIRELNLDRVALSDKQEANTDALQEALHRVLVKHASSLNRLRLCASNVTGRLFYKGKAFPVKDPARERVSVEAKRSDGHSVVRDDSPMRRFQQNGTKYHYVKTTYDASTETFMRFYVELDWLRALFYVDMSNCKVSGYGLTSLCAATANTMQILLLPGCPFVDDRGLHAIANQCKALSHLDISNCPRVTAHGLLYLPRLTNCHLLQKVLIANQCVTNSVATALLKLLEDRRFRGHLFWHPDRHGVPALHSNPRVSGGPTCFQRHYERFPEKIWNLALEDITETTLSRTGTGAIHLDMTNQLVDDEILNQVTSRWGARLVSLKLTRTFVTEKGLVYLKRCPNLNTLHLAQCWNILDKQEANNAIKPAVTAMTNLADLDVSDTRLSGRMLSNHPKLQLRELNASRSPMSVHAVRMLQETCHSSMHVLRLSGCHFLNSKAIHYFMLFSQLRTLDLSFCAGLSFKDIMELKNFYPSYLRHFSELNVTGVPGMNSGNAQELADLLTARSLDKHQITVVSGSEDNKESFTGEFVMDNCPYTPVSAVTAGFSTFTPEEEKTVFRPKSGPAASSSHAAQAYGPMQQGAFPDAQIKAKKTQRKHNATWTGSQAYSAMPTAPHPARASSTGAKALASSTAVRPQQSTTTPADCYTLFASQHLASPSSKPSADSSYGPLSSTSSGANSNNNNYLPHLNLDDDDDDDEEDDDDGPA